jgi:hypothetical protein
MRAREGCCFAQPRETHWLRQAKEISRVLKMGIPEGEDIDISLLEHVSPIEWENVILYGQYVLNPDDIR